MSERTWRLSARAYGLFELSIFSFIGYLPSIVAFASSEDLPSRALYGVLASASSFSMVDGFIDALKGSHHFVTLTTWRMLSRDQAQKDVLDASIKEWAASFTRKIASFLEFG